MPEQTDKVLISFLSEMTEHCRAMQHLLKQDQNQFSQNNLKPIPASNQQKSLLIEKITQLTQQLMHPSETDTNVLQIIEARIANAELLHPLKKASLEFKNELALCYQAVLTNNHIVTANLQHLKNIWDKLAACRSEQSAVYDRSGNTVK